MGVAAPSPYAALPLASSRGPGPSGLRAVRRCGAAIETPPARVGPPSVGGRASFGRVCGRREGAVIASIAAGYPPAAQGQLVAILGAVGPQPPTTPTGQPPLCAWPSPLCSPARRQGSSRAAKGLPLTPAAERRQAPLARGSNHTQRGLSHVHTSQQSARPAPDGAGAGCHAPETRPRAGAPCAAAPLSAGAHRAGVLRRFPVPPTFRRVSSSASA